MNLPEEVQYLSGRPLSGGVVLFLVNRYTTLVNRVARLIQFVNWSGFSEVEADKVSIESRC